MNLDLLLKALPIFAIISTITSTWTKNLPPTASEVIVAVEQWLDQLILSRRLPADFKNNLGNLIADLVAIHPAVPLPPKP